MSEKRRIHSLNPNCSRRSLSWRRRATPTHRGRDASPSSKVSQRRKIFCSGNTSVAEKEGEEEGK